MWKWRGLTLIGKIQIVKSFAIPKFMSKASLIHVSKDLIQAVNKELYSFIWKGKDKVKRLALINDIENGGLKMLDIESMVLAQRTMCLKKYIEDYVSPWKIFLNHYLKKLGGKFILQCHFDCQKLPIFLPEFYKDCLAAWSTLSSKEVCSYEDVMNQYLWNNKNILCEGKSLYYAFFHINCGISKIGDLVSKDNTFLESDKILRSKLSPSQYFLLMGVVGAIPKEWRSIIKGESIYCETYPCPANSFEVPIKGEMLDISSISSKIVYEEFLSRKVIPPTAQNKYKKEYPNLSVDWKKIYSLAFSVTLDTKLRAFQYKLLNHILYTNDRLYKFKIVDSPLCAFCNSENESLEHLLFLCTASEVFWKEVLSWLAIHKNELLNVSLTDVLFRKFDIDKDFMVVNHVLLLGKYFIYRCKLDNIKPSLAVFKAKLKATLNLEFYIARKNGTLAQHYRKWNIFIPVLI